MEEIRDKKAIKHAEKKQQNVKSKSFSINNISVNGLNSSVKRHRLAEWIKKKKKKPTIHLYVVYKRLTLDKGQK